MGALKKIKDFFYNILVRRVPEIQRYYESYVDADKERHRKKRGQSWALLLKCNFHYYFRRRLPETAASRTETKRLYTGGSESSLSLRETPEQLAEKLRDYDVISFDLFDTLVYRPVARPADLFYFVGARLEYMGFHQLRVQAERRARNRKYQEQGTWEVTLQEIYQCLQDDMGAEAWTAMEAELQTELSLCFANPYMKRLYTRLREQGKTVIIISDMYLPAKVLRNILHNCGFVEPEQLLVSCEWGKSKHEGTLFQLAKERLGTEKSFAHVGDNFGADVDAARKNGFFAVYYPNAQEKGLRFRPDTMSRMVGSAYAGTVNTWLHNGASVYSPQYEYGYIVGGLLVLGYCTFIHRYAAAHQIDKILFLARDGKLLHEVYRRLYPEARCEYVYWSRLASVKLAAERYKRTYFTRFVEHNSHGRMTLHELVAGMELEALEERLQQQLSSSMSERLTPQNAGQVVQALEKLWPEVLACYEQQQQAARQYWQSVLQGCRRACAVDIGWAGSGAVFLRYLVQHKWQIPCEIIGLLAGTDTFYTAEADESVSFLQTEKLVPYLYSEGLNREFWSTHNPGKRHNVYLEMLLTSREPSLKGFALDPDGGVRLDFCAPDPVDGQLIAEIQQGVLDFVENYCRHFAAYPELFTIPGHDAYLPFRLALNSEKDYFKLVFPDLDFKENIL